MVINDIIRQEHFYSFAEVVKKYNLLDSHLKIYLLLNWLIIEFFSDLITPDQDSELLVHSQNE